MDGFCGARAKDGSRSRLGNAGVHAKGRNLLMAVAATTAGLLSPVGLLAPEAASAQSAVHKPGPLVPGHKADFSGVWAKVDQFSEGSADLRPADSAAMPPFNAELTAKYNDIIAKATRGERYYDGTSICLPPGAPRFALFMYPKEILMTPGQVTILSEYFNETRRIFTDGRSPPPADELEPTFRGYSTGQWQGDTLVVHTIGVNDRTVYGSLLPIPHSPDAKMTERIRLIDDDHLEWTTTIEDPKKFTKPWVRKTVLQRTGDEILEFICADGNKHDVNLPTAVHSPDAAQ
jgi:hypothetical protein